MGMMKLLVPLFIGGSILFGLVALIAGIVALVRINRSEGKLRGKGFALAAIVIGALLLLGVPVFGVVGAGLLWVSSGKGPDVRHERVIEEPEGHDVKITTDIGKKPPPEYGEKKKIDIFKDAPEAK
jgi:Domain of unknown function (DUF4190)